MWNDCACDLSCLNFSGTKVRPKKKKKDWWRWWPSLIDNSEMQKGLPLVNTEMGDLVKLLLAGPNHASKRLCALAARS